MTRRLPAVLVPTSGNGQWTHGEAINDMKLHRRIDVPLDQLGAIARTWNADLDHFYGHIAASITAVALNNMGFTVDEDTANGWDSVNAWYAIRYSGLYMVTVAGAAATATSFRLQLSVGDSLGTVSTHQTAVVSGIDNPVVGGGPAMSYVMRRHAGDTISVNPNVSYTTPASTATGFTNWLRIQQLTWG